MSGDPYQRVARIYDRLFERFNGNLQSLGVRMTGPGPGMQVLDVGCGTGTQLALYRQAGCAIHGIDTSPAMLAVARQRLGRGADLCRGDARQLPYPDACFDIVLCMLVLHEMDPLLRKPVLAEMRRVLRPDGCLLLVDYHYGRAVPFKGWLLKPVVYLAEFAAGRRHFRNYRQFMASGGLPGLVESAQLVEQQRRVVAGNLLALHLLRRQTPQDSGTL